MEKFLDFIQLIIQSMVVGFFFGIGILSSFLVIGLLVMNKILPIVNKFIATL